MLTLFLDMKKTLAHLEKEKKEDLKKIVQYVLDELPCCEMIILYGSYARGDYVEYDQRTEFGIRTYFMSDFDLLVVTNKRFKSYIISNILRKAAERYYQDKGGKRFFCTRIQFINEGIEDLNRALCKGRYFYTDIKREGIMLYDSGRYKLARRRRLNFREIKELAQEYFEEKFEFAETFLDVANYLYVNKNYKVASFNLHQACENFYHCILLTYTLYTHKEHDLEILSNYIKTHSLHPSEVFPRDTEDEKDLFELLNNAYVQARYNPQFTIDKKNVKLLYLRIKLMRSITKTICIERLNYYESRTARKELERKFIDPSEIDKRNYCEDEIEDYE